MDDNRTPSSGLPGEPHQVPRPTVIMASGGGLPPKPTVIGGGQPAKLTTINTGSSTPISPPKPTTIISPTPIASPPQTVQAPPTVHKPTGIAGAVIRQRLPLTLADLRTKNPGVSEKVLERAMYLIQTTNLEAISDTEVVLWGQKPQKDYGNLISELLKVVQSEPLQKVQDHIARLIAVLSLIDLAKVCDTSHGGNFLTHAFRKATTAIDTPEELDEALVEIGQLVQLMDQKTKSLLDLKGQLEIISGKIDGAGNEIEALSIAAAFLADHFKDSQNPYYPRFLERSGSLTTSLAQIRSSGQMRKMQVEQPLDLIAIVQGVALVQVPAWLGSIVTVKSMLARKQKPTVTALRELSDQTSQVINQLSKGNT